MADDAQAQAQAQASQMDRERAAERKHRRQIEVSQNSSMLEMSQGLNSAIKSITKPGRQPGRESTSPFRGRLFDQSPVKFNAAAEAVFAHIHIAKKKIMHQLRIDASTMIRQVEELMYQLDRILANSGQWICGPTGNNIASRKHTKPPSTQCPL